MPVQLSSCLECGYSPISSAAEACPRCRSSHWRGTTCPYCRKTVRRSSSSQIKWSQQHVSHTDGYAFHPECLSRMFEVPADAKCASCELPLSPTFDWQQITSVLRQDHPQLPSCPRCGQPDVLALWTGGSCRKCQFIVVGSKEYHAWCAPPVQQQPREPPSLPPARAKERGMPWYFLGFNDFDASLFLWAFLILGSIGTCTLMSR